MLTCELRKLRAGTCRCNAGTRHSTSHVFAALVLPPPPPLLLLLRQDVSRGAANSVKASP